MTEDRFLLAISRVAISIRLKRPEVRQTGNGGIAVRLRTTISSNWMR